MDVSVDFDVCDKGTAMVSATRLVELTDKLLKSCSSWKAHSTGECSVCQTPGDFGLSFDQIPPSFGKNSLLTPPPYGLGQHIKVASPTGALTG